jgi:hypothetical protein
MLIGMIAPRGGMRVALTGCPTARAAAPSRSAADPEQPRENAADDADHDELIVEPRHGTGLLCSARRLAWARMRSNFIICGSMTGSDPNYAFSFGSRDLIHHGRMNAICRIISPSFGADVALPLRPPPHAATVRGTAAERRRRRRSHCR